MLMLHNSLAVKTLQKLRQFNGQDSSTSNISLDRFVGVIGSSILIDLEKGFGFKNY